MHAAPHTRLPPQRSAPSEGRSHGAGPSALPRRARHRQRRAAGARPNSGVVTPEGADAQTVALVRQAATPITGAAADYDPLMRLVGDARVVMLGESTHGTHEFYRERARITQRLITEKGFSAVAIEGDWPDAYRVNQYVRGLGSDASAEQALSSFTQFPRGCGATRRSATS
jgi:hypothetical protein